MAVPIVMAGLHVMQALGSAYAQRQQAKATRAVSKSNEAIAEIQGRLAKRGGEKTLARHRQEIKKTLGKQRAAMAAQGIRLDGGSAQDVQQETQDIGELDALTIKINTAREVFGFKQQASEARFEGKQAKIAGSFGAILPTLITGGLQAATAMKGSTGGMFTKRSQVTHGGMHSLNPSTPMYGR